MISQHRRLLSSEKFFEMDQKMRGFLILQSLYRTQLKHPKFKLKINILFTTPNERKLENQVLCTPYHYPDHWTTMRLDAKQLCRFTLECLFTPSPFIPLLKSQKLCRDIDIYCGIFGVNISSPLVLTPLSDFRYLKCFNRSFQASACHVFHRSSLYFLVVLRKLQRIYAKTVQSRSIVWGIPHRDINSLFL